MISRPRKVPSKTQKVKLACGTIYITVSYLDNKPFEVFLSMGKQGTCTNAMVNALATSISIGLRGGVDAQYYINHIKGISCQNYSIDDGIGYTSCADAVSKYMDEVNKWLKSNPQSAPAVEKKSAIQSPVSQI